jgi:prefoldin subunit 5
MVEELIVHNEEKHMNSVKDVLNLKFMQAAIPIKKQMEAINEFREAVQNELAALTAQADKVQMMVKQFAV